MVGFPLLYQMLKPLTFLIAGVWLANGLFAKVLNLVPRHTEIVAGILGSEYARPLTIIIAIILTMNTLEGLLVPELLLWGYLNPLFAALFCGLVYWNGCYIEGTRS
jgi:hypothetical protein